MRNPESTKNFEKYPKKRIDTLGLPYDITSIMHYTHGQGAKEGLSSLEPVNTTVLIIGHYYKIVNTDVLCTVSIWTETFNFIFRSGLLMIWEGQLNPMIMIT